MYALPGQWDEHSFWLCPHFSWLNVKTHNDRFGVRGVLWWMIQDDTNAHLLLAWAGVWSTSHKPKESLWELGVSLELHCLVGTPAPLHWGSGGWSWEIFGFLGKWMVIPKVGVQTQLWITQPVTLGCSCHLFEPQFSHQQNGSKTFLHHCVIFRPPGNARVCDEPRLLKFSRFNKAVS